MDNNLRETPQMLVPDEDSDNSWLHQIKRLQTYLKKLYFENKQLYPTPLFIVAIETDNRFLISLLVLSCWKLPICLFPISRQYSDEYKKQLLKQCNIKILITNRTNIADFSYILLNTKQLLKKLSIHTNLLPDLLNFQILYQQLKSEENHPEKNSIPKLIITTSGTTDNPKAVYLSSKNILSHCRASREFIKLDKQSIWLNCLPLNHVAGLLILYRTMVVQACVLLQDSFSEHNIFHLFTFHKVSHISLVPVMLQKLIDLLFKTENITYSFSDSLNYLLIGGSKISENLLIQAKKFNLPIIYGYGSSESCSHITLIKHNFSIKEGTLSPTLATLSDNKISSGKPLAGVEIRIKHSISNKLPGLIQYRGNMVMEGYANPDYLIGNGKNQQWFCSNDLGYINSQGELFVLGRNDRILNSGGLKINPQEVEKMMSYCPGADTIFIYAVEDEIWGQIVAMDYYGEWNVKQIKHWIHDNIKSPYKPRIIKKILALF